MLSVKDINLLQSQNEGLKKQNAELQKENVILKEENYNKLIAWEEMQAENERLKEEIKEVKKYQYQQEYLDKEIEEMQKALKTLAEGLNIRQQTLQDIKAIAEGCITKDTCYDCKYCDDCYIEDVEIPTYDVCKLIIQKITKAESEVE